MSIIKNYGKRRKPLENLKYRKSPDFEIKLINKHTGIIYSHLSIKVRLEEKRPWGDFCLFRLI